MKLLPDRKILWLPPALLAVSLFPSGILAAEYKEGFQWNWEADFTVFDATPSDYGSLNLSANTGKSKGKPTEDVWRYAELETSAPSSLKPLAEFTPYYTREGYAWQNKQNPVPAIGIDTGPTYHFTAPLRGRHYLIPKAVNPPCDSVALEWNTPQDGQFDIEGDFVLPELSKPSCKGEDGVIVSVRCRDEFLISRQRLTRTNRLPFKWQKLSLRKGETILITIAAGNNQHCDETLMNLIITLSGKLLRTDADTEN